MYLSTSKKCRKSAKSDGDFGNDENCFKKRKSCVISIEAKNRSKIAMYLIFFPVKAESPYFSMKMRLLVSGP